MPAKLTKEIVNERIAGRGIVMIGPYRGNHTKTDFQCRKAHVWAATPNNIMRGNNCPHCSGRAKQDKEQINERLRPLGFRIVGDYKNTNVNCEIQCEDGHIWITRPAHVLRGSKCPVCANNAPLSKEIVNARLAGRGIQLIGEYKGINTKSPFRCLDGHQWKAKPSNVLHNGTGCPICYGVTPYSKDELNEKLSARGIEIIGEYKNVHEKTLLKGKCGHQWSTTVSSILRGTGCRKCQTTKRAAKRKLTLETINSRLAERGIRLVGQYIKSRVPAELECKDGHRWKATLDSAMRVSNCPHCADYGFNHQKAAVVYFLKVDHRQLAAPVYKVGITNRTVKDRIRRLFPAPGAEIEILGELHYENGADALAMEKRLHAEFAAHRYTGEIAVIENGHTELFTLNIWRQIAPQTEPA